MCLFSIYTFQVQCLPGDKLAVSSLNQSKDRDLSVWDIRACKKLNSLTFGNSNRTMSLLFDVDTNLLFLGQRGEVFIHCLEVGDSSPYLSLASSYLGKTETKSLCLIPKRAVDVMKCEIDRILQLTRRDIVPISFSVTRKSYVDYHSDLYPDTFGHEPGMTAQEWVDGMNRAPKLTTLDPQLITRAKAKLQSVQTKSETNTEPEPEPEPEEILPIKPVKVIPGIRSTPFKHLEGKLAHKSTFIFDLPPLCKSIPLDGHMLQVSYQPSHTSGLVRFATNHLLTKIAINRIFLAAANRPYSLVITLTIVYPQATIETLAMPPPTPLMFLSQHL